MEDYITKWAKANEFNEEGLTYIVKGDSYSIKDELKAAGFKFSKPLGWHRATNEGYEDITVAIYMNDVYEFYNWGGFSVKGEAVSRIRVLTQPPQKPTEYYESSTGTVKDMVCTLAKVGGYETNYGHSFIYTFENDRNVFVWFTKVTLDFKVGDKVKICAGIKGYKDYDGIHQTIITRCKTVQVTE